MPNQAVTPIPRRTATPLGLAPVHAPVPVRHTCFFTGGVEPPLADMLRDPIVAMVMRRDRVSADDVLSVMRAAAAHCD